MHSVPCPSLNGVFVRGIWDSQRFRSLSILIARIMVSPWQIICAIRTGIFRPLALSIPHSARRRAAAAWCARCVFLLSYFAPTGCCVLMLHVLQSSDSDSHPNATTLRPSDRPRASTHSPLSDAQCTLLHTALSASPRLASPSSCSPASQSSESSRAGAPPTR